jgi:hypothetical protein
MSTAVGSPRFKPVMPISKQDEEAREMSQIGAENHIKQITTLPGITFTDNISLLS